MFREVLFGVCEGLFWGFFIVAAMWAAAIALSALLVGLILLIA